MLPTSIRHALACTTLALFVGAALASETAPRVLEEPAFGMRYETAKVKFDTLPADVLSRCRAVADDDKAPRILHLYGKARDAAGNAYYLVDGDYYGSTVFKINGEECSDRGTVETSFGNDAPVLSQLAADIASRYIRAFGADQLRTELRNQRVEPERLPSQLRQAFLPYMAPPQYVLTNDSPLQVLRDPFLGLRHEASAKFDPLPGYALDTCGEWFGHDQFFIGHYRVYAQARDAGGTYFVIGGFWEMRGHAPSSLHPLYVLDPDAHTFKVQGKECVMYSHRRARFVFKDPEVPQPILRQLASDFVARLVKAFGHDLLRMELRNQHVDQNGLPAELRAALKPYLMN